jgi:hypothetical protein
MALGVAAALPAAVVTLGLLVFAARELSGTTPLSDGPPRNIAEAAGGGRDSEVLRFLRAGQDPSRVWPMRREVISSTVLRATALEAAVWSRREPLIEVLDGRGLIADMETRRHLICLASDLSIGDIATYLSRGAPPACEPGKALELVKARSRPQ